MAKKGEISSEKFTISSGGTQLISRDVRATQIEVFVESGFVRIRTDGKTATDSTGEPLGAGYSDEWNCVAISVYATEDSVITVVNR
jgi:hypothetical protein